MLSKECSKVIQSVLDSEMSFCKFLSANDSGATGGHQSGILISKKAATMLFSEYLPPKGIQIGRAHV